MVTPGGIMEEEKKQIKKTNVFYIRIGPKLKQLIEKQIDIIKEVTWNEVKASNFEAGEIIARKIIDNNLI